MIWGSVRYVNTTVPDAAFCVENLSFSLMACDFAFHTNPAPHLHRFACGVGLLSRLRLRKVAGSGAAYASFMFRDASLTCIQLV